jgi:undecaprenyl-diphosphatase
MNNDIFYFFYNLAHQSEWLDKLIVFAAVYLPFIVVFLALWYLLFRRKSFGKFFFVFFAAGLAGLISKLLKTLIQAQRPPLILSDVQALIEKTSYSFPSDHATFFFALGLSIFFIRKKAGLWFLLFAFIIGAARIAAGIHFPIDIAGGYVLGALVAYFLKKV